MTVLNAQSDSILVVEDGSYNPSADDGQTQVMPSILFSNAASIELFGDVTGGLTGPHPIRGCNERLLIVPQLVEL